MRDKKSNDTIR